MDELGLAYVALSVLLGLIGAVGVWIAAITQSGIAIGATLGAVAAFFSFYIIALVWPLLAIVYAWKREASTIWIRSLFAPKRLLS